MKKIIATIFASLSLAAVAAGGGDYKPNDPANTRLEDKASLQRGATLYMNYCMGCHGLEFSRYKRMAQDLNIQEDVLAENLIFDGSKPGDLMKTAMPNKSAEIWFGAAPPDLSLIARYRGNKWLYNYLRAFYKDETRPYGVNNTVFPDVGMPHVLEPLQGMQYLSEEGELALITEGALTPEEYDVAIRDLVNFLDYVGEPAKVKRHSLGVYVLLFILVFFVLAYFLKKEYWKDIH
ncbi:MAG: cytochrome c1 [Gammaproteobacteria bacterium]|nr:cytochrome c1 [Gammaproteobacteria bacterium]NVK87403.1 cytochrome c1 [Gammaproteobacteria bacterium]